MKRVPPQGRMWASDSKLAPDLRGIVGCSLGWASVHEGGSHQSSSG